MKERPILFSWPMVRAILDGRKTQTRRIVRPQPRGIWGSGVALEGNILGVRSNAFGVHCNVGGEHIHLYCPFGKPGDHLWIRETAFPDFPKDEYCYEWTWAEVPAEFRNPAHVLYRASWEGGGLSIEWKPPMSLPRWASRISLEITGVRVERLKDISEEDAKAEGVTPEIVDATKEDGTPVGARHDDRPAGGEQRRPPADRPEQLLRARGPRLRGHANRRIHGDRRA